MISSPVPVSHRVWLFGLVALILLYLIAPLFIVIPVSFSDSKYLEFPPRAYSLKWYVRYLDSAEAGVHPRLADGRDSDSGRRYADRRGRGVRDQRLRSALRAAGLDPGPRPGHRAQHADRHRHLLRIYPASAGEYDARYRSRSLATRSPSRGSHGARGTPELRHAPGDGCSQPGGSPAWRVCAGDTATDQDSRPLRRALRFHHVPLDEVVVGLFVAAGVKWSSRGGCSCHSVRSRPGDRRQFDVFHLPFPRRIWCRIPLSGSAMNCCSEAMASSCDYVRTERPR